MMIIKVRADWDPEAKVWYVEDSNVLGLHIEAETREKLYEKASWRNRGFAWEWGTRG